MKKYAKKKPMTKPAKKKTGYKKKKY